MQKLFFASFLEEIGLDDATVKKLMNGGFDDHESLKNLDTGLMNLMGFENVEETY
jgi:hypothetical protein